MTDLEHLATPELLRLAEAAALADATGDADERWAPVYALHERADAEVFESAAAFCARPEPLLRRLGADVLAQLGVRNDLPFAERSEPLLLALLNDADEQVIACALVALGHLRRGDPLVLRPFAQHACADVRQALGFALSLREDPDAIAILIGLTQDADDDVRSWSTFGLAMQTEVDTPELRAALRARLHDSDREVRDEAMFSLATRGDEAAVEPLREQLESDDCSTLTIEAAAAYGRAEFLPGLRALLAEQPDDPAVLDAIAQCSGEGDEPFVED